MIPTILVIAGSDPTGGAGIQADLKTMTSIGVFAAAAISCVTVQNSHGVSAVQPLPVGLVRDQIQAVLEDHQVSHVKIGMVGTDQLAEVIAETLKPFSGKIIYDPVLSSSTGQKLYGRENESCGLLKLLSRTWVLTPNLPELEILSGRTVRSPEEGLSAAESLMTRFPDIEAILVKGGHSDTVGDVVDFLVHRVSGAIATESMPHRRIRTKNSHGTGCTLASAFTAFHQIHGDLIRAFRESILYLDTVMKRSAGKAIVINRDGLGPLLHHTWRNS